MCCLIHLLRNFRWLHNHSCGRQWVRLQRGFTFLEMFIAMAMLAVVVMAVFQSLVTLLGSSRLLTEDYTASILLNNAFAEPLMQPQATGAARSKTQRVTSKRTALPQQLQEQIRAPMVVMTVQTATTVPAVFLQRTMLLYSPQKSSQKEKA